MCQQAYVTGSLAVSAASGHKSRVAISLRLGCPDCKLFRRLREKTPEKCSFFGCNSGESGGFAAIVRFFDLLLALLCWS